MTKHHKTASHSKKSTHHSSAHKKKRKVSAYAHFVKAFAAKHKGLKGPQLMKQAAAAWRAQKK